MNNKDKDRQEELERNWKKCFVCEKLIIEQPEQNIVYCELQGFRKDENSLVGWFSSHISKSSGLVQRIHIHQQCFLDAAGEEFKFWKDE